MTKKAIVKNLNEFRDRITHLRDRINSGRRPRRGVGTAGLKANKSLYKLGGKHI